MFKFMPMNAYGWCFYITFTFAYITILIVIASVVYDVMEKIVNKMKEGIKNEEYTSGSK